MKTLLLRCEASVELGTGHFMRCLGIAEEWERRGNHAVFAMSDKAIRFLPPPLLSRINLLRVAAPPTTAEDAIETAQLCELLSASWIAVDGFDFGSQWHLAFPKGMQLLRIGEDIPEFAIHADAILNSDPGAAPADYPSVQTRCRFLLGLKYVIIRKEFLGFRHRLHRKSNVLVTMGGTDPAHFTSVCLRALQKHNTEKLSCEFLLGPRNPDREALQRKIMLLAPRLRVSPSEKSVPETFASAAWAVTAGGTSIHELGFLGIPMLIVATTARQVTISERFADLGAACFLGSHEQITAERLANELERFSADLELHKRCRARCLELIDGNGVARVVDQLMANTK